MSSGYFACNRHLCKHPDTKVLYSCEHHITFKGLEVFPLVITYIVQKVKTPPIKQQLFELGRVLPIWKESCETPGAQSPHL